MATETAVPSMTHDSLTDEFMDERQFAALMGKTLRTIRLWEQKREGPPRIKIGKTVRYRKGAIEQWLRSRESRPCRVPRARRARREASRG